MWLNDAQQQRLLALAWDSIRCGLETGKPLSVAAGDYPPELREPTATFVTLERNGQLRGCIGRLKASRPLAEDVAENAYAAAFRDGRFPPLTTAELNGLEAHISLLSPAEPLQFSSEQDLIRQLQPNVDGLILEYDGRQATFLPSVWESLPNGGEFLAHLKQKAGLPKTFWSDGIRAYRYTTAGIGEKYPG
ncbi:MAG: AmmeMemoRadiSam system protein A [Methylomonas sp.]|jgi:AmmeMemoRadiSam system protein A